MNNHGLKYERIGRLRSIAMQRIAEGSSKPAEALLELANDFEALLRERDEWKARAEWLAERCADELYDSCPYLELYQDTGCRPDYCVCTDTAEDGFDCTELPKKCWLKESAARPRRKEDERARAERT